MQNKIGKVEVIHFSGSKEDYKPIRRLCPSYLELVEAEPDFNFMMKWIEKVGGDSGWHLRKEYHEEHAIQETIKGISESGARMFLMTKRGKEIGFTHTTKTFDLNSVFKGIYGTARRWSIFGLIEEERFGTIGAHLANAMAKKIFEENDRVYFQTRPSNKVHSVKFWQKQGFQIIGTEMIDNDVLSESVIKQKYKKSASLIAGLSNDNSAVA